MFHAFCPPAHVWSSTTTDTVNIKSRDPRWPSKCPYCFADAYISAQFVEHRDPADQRRCGTK